MADFLFKTYLEFQQAQGLTGGVGLPFAQTTRDISDSVIALTEYYGT